MKKIIAIAAMLLMVISANAQFSWGIKAGANITTMSTTSEVFSASNRTGFYVGPTAKFTLPIVGLGLDISALYDQRETKVSNDENSETISNKTIAIPLNVRYQIVGLGDMASIYAYTGPQIAFNIGKKKYDVDINGSKYEGAFKNSYMSWNLGLGAMIASHFQVNANYNIAVGKTGDQENIAGAAGEAASALFKDVFSTKNSGSWQIGVTYYF